jgi:DNA-directed RNA polymerase specialized sigma24 family protein
MSEARIQIILQQLSKGNAHDAWTEFIDEYAPLIFDVVRRFEPDPDGAADCFQFVCERLCEARFRRLLKFTFGGPAKFSTWLRAVVRNLCLDRRRKQFGRRRMFQSIARLSELDQRVFQLVYERGLSENEALPLLTAAFLYLTPGLLSASVARISTALTAKQRWRLSQRKAFSQQSVPLEDSEIAVEDSAANPEMRVIIEERRRILLRAVSRLETPARLLIRLRYEEGLTLAQIARLLELGSAQRVDRQIKDILSSLRAEFESSSRDFSGKDTNSSVKVN